MGVTGSRALIGTLLAGLVLLIPAASAALEAVPAWGGRFVPGEPTEVTVHMTSPAGGTVLLRIEGDGGTLEHNLPVEAGRRATTVLPAWPGADGRLALTAFLPDGAQQRARLDLHPRRERLHVLVLAPEAAPGHIPDDAVLVRTRDLPRHAVGYRPLASLTLGPSDLAALEAGQARALAGHLAACGVLVLPGADAALLARVRAASGCGGGGVGADAVPAPARALPSSQRLAGLLPEGTGGADLALLLLPYPLILLALALPPRGLPWLLLLPPAAALAWAGVLPQAVPSAVSVTWAETVEGDVHHRFATLLRANGRGFVQAPLHLPQAAGLVLAGSVRVTAPGDNAIDPPDPFLARRDYRLEGTGVLPFRLRMADEGEGVRIDNAGPQPSPAGWLLWQGRAAPTPALAPGGTHWVNRRSVTSEPPIALPVMPEPGLLLALPGPLPQGADPRIRAEGWLLVREDPTAVTGPEAGP